MARFWVPYKRPEKPLTEAQRMTKLHHELQQCAYDGTVSERESVRLMEAALRLLREEWQED